MKACSSCGAVKPLAEFRLLVRATKKPCRLGKCLDCERAAARARMAAQRESGRAWENAKRWREENRERYLELKRAESQRRRDRQRESLGLPPLPTPEERAEKAALRSMEQAIAKARRQEKRESLASRPRPPEGLNKTEQWRWRYQNDPEFNLRQRMRTSARRAGRRYGWIWKYFGSQARSGSGRRLWAFLGYGPDDLRSHLERQFTKGMTWERFLAGEIHIDHIQPVVSFDLNDETEARACYCLSNLRPLWARENMAKGARVDALV